MPTDYGTSVSNVEFISCLSEIEAFIGTLPTGFSAMHWYMPVFPATGLEMVKVLMLRLGPVTEVTPSAFPPLCYQVTVGMGIPSYHTSEYDSLPTSFSRSLEGDIVILGGAVLRKEGVCYKDCD